MLAFPFPFPFAGGAAAAFAAAGAAAGLALAGGVLALGTSCVGEVMAASPVGCRGSRLWGSLGTSLWGSLWRWCCVRRVWDLIHLLEHAVKHFGEVCVALVVMELGIQPVIWSIVQKDRRSSCHSLGLLFAKMYSAGIA